MTVVVATAAAAVRAGGRAARGRHGRDSDARELGGRACTQPGSGVRPDRRRRRGAWRRQRRHQGGWRGRRRALLTVLTDRATTASLALGVRANAQLGGGASLGVDVIDLPVIAASREETAKGGRRACAAAVAGVLSTGALPRNEDGRTRARPASAFAPREAGCAGGGVAWRIASV